MKRCFASLITVEYNVAVNSKEIIFYHRISDGIEVSYKPISLLMGSTIIY